jgi:hypothetical protein
VLTDTLPNHNSYDTQQDAHYQNNVVLGITLTSVLSGCFQVLSVHPGMLYVCMYKGWAFTALAPRPTVVYCA